VYLMFDSDLVADYRQSSGLDTIPLAELGLLVSNPGMLDRALAEAFGMEGRQRAWRETISTLPEPSDAARQIHALILSDFMGSSHD
jgi:hypothetical protein